MYFDYVVNDGLVFMFYINKNVFRYKVFRVDVGNLVVWFDVILELYSNVIMFVKCVNSN